MENNQVSFVGASGAHEYFSMELKMIELELELLKLELLKLELSKGE